MKKIYLIAVLSLLASSQLLGQGKPNYVGQWYGRAAQGKSPAAVDLFSRGPSDFTRTRKYNLRANVNQLSSVLRTAPALLDLVVPYGDQTYTLNLARVEVASANLNVRTNQGNSRYTPGVQYRGIVNGNQGHIASLSLSANDISGFFSTDEGNFIITKEGMEYIVYNDQVLEAPGLILCSTPDTLSYQIPTQGSLITGIGCKVVNVYVECDYALFQTKGSNTTAVADYVIAFFNQVATLYANENVAIQLSEIFVWTSPDPFASFTTTGDVLNSFRSSRGSGYNGDLAHFLSTRNLGGGVAYVNVLCNKAYAYGVSQVYSTYNNFPTYSWTVEVVAHELGHNLGSPHTHSCSWSSGALDNCYTPEGSCPVGPSPSGGGTVMSYCHLTATGINFNYGFGYEPGNRIRDRVLNATCLSGSSAPAPTSLSATNITTSSATLNWVGSSGATNYTVQYRLASSAAWTAAGATSATSMNISGLSPNSAYVWNVRSDCSNFSAESSFNTTGTATGCPAPSQLSSGGITPTGATLSWGGVSGANSYTVQYRPSSVSTWNSLNAATNSVALGSLAAGTTYIWQVRADCSPYSAQSSFTTATVVTPPAGTCAKTTNLTVSGVTSRSATLSWAPVSGAQSYTVTVQKAGGGKSTTYNAGGTTLNVSGLQRRTSYEWMVNTNCSGGATSGFTAAGTFVTP